MSTPFFQLANIDTMDKMSYPIDMRYTSNQRKESANRLRQLMKAKNISVTALAYELGVVPSTVYRWLEGERSIHPKYLHRLTQILNTTADYLFALSPEPFPGYGEVMDLPKHKRFDYIVQLVREHTVSPLVVYEDTLRRAYMHNEIDEVALYQQIYKQMQTVKKLLEKSDSKAFSDHLRE